MFIIREGARHEAGDEGDTCRSNSHAIETRWSMVSCPESDEDQLKSSKATCDRLWSKEKGERENEFLLILFMGGVSGG